MTRLIYSGIFDELPSLKIISHHMGGMIPYFPSKIKLGFRQIFFGTTEKNPVAEEAGLKLRRTKANRRARIRPTCRLFCCVRCAQKPEFVRCLPHLYDCRNIVSASVFDVRL